METNGQLTAVMGAALINTANTNITGSGATVLLTGADNGTYVTSVVIKAVTDTTEGMIRLFIEDASSGFLIVEIPVIATKVSDIVPRYTRVASFDDLFLPAGYKLKVATVVSEGFNVVANGSNLDYPTA